MSNQNSILLSNDSETLDSLNKNTDTVLFSGDTDTISASVSHTTPKLTSSIHKHAYLADDNKHHTKSHRTTPKEEEKIFLKKSSLNLKRLIIIYFERLQK